MKQGEKNNKVFDFLQRIMESSSKWVVSNILINLKVTAKTQERASKLSWTQI